MGTYYINADIGDNVSGDGSISNPWETVSYANSNASETNSTLILQNSTGNYLWTPETFTNMTTVRGESAIGCVLDGTGIISSDNGWRPLNNEPFLIENLTFQNITISGNQKQVFSFNGVVGTRNLILNQCIIKNIFLTPNNHSTVVAFHPIDSTGILTIKNCLFYNLSGFPGQTPRLIGITANSPVGCDIHDSTFIFDAPSGNEINWHADYGVTLKNGIMKNNIFYNAQGVGGTGVTMDFDIFTDPPAKTFDNNCYYGKWTTGVIVSSGLNNITGDPLFMDASNNDFRLRQGSPCIDNGVVE